MQTATCHTEGCGNQDQAIALDFIPDDEPVEAVICGVCGNTITDVT